VQSGKNQSDVVASSFEAESNKETSVAALDADPIPINVENMASPPLQTRDSPEDLNIGTQLVDSSDFEPSMSYSVSSPVGVARARSEIRVGPNLPDSSDIFPNMYNTGLHMFKPTHPVTQRVTYSQHYAGNVAKGGIFAQLCGWVGTHELYPGNMSDSDYLNKTGILSQQQQFAEEDVGSDSMPFTNILDKGYRSTQAAWRNGGQFVLQPSFAKSDRKFKATETLRSASVAADRSANERAVRVTKRSAYVKRGYMPRQDVNLYCDVWLAWGFQVNFIYAPVL